jgi:asparagine N-glycosylation enzyme membrane subunit Stt3
LPGPREDAYKNIEDFYKIAYTFNGTRINGSFLLEMRPALDWIKSNTSANDTVVSWWDYGHAIRGYAGRDSAIYMASKNLVNSVADRNKEGRPWESEQKVKAVSDILLAPNDTQLKQGMESFGARYILTTARDSSGIAYAIIQGAGKDPDDYIRTVDGAAVPKDSARDMFLFKIWSGGEFPGTRIVYKDINTIIVEIE